MSKLREILDSRRAPGFRQGVADPTDVDVAAPRGLKDMEEKLGTTRMERALGMKAGKLKKIWDMK